MPVLRDRLAGDMARTPKPRYLKGIDARTKSAQLPRRRKLGDPPGALSRPETEVWLEIARCAPRGHLGGESRGLLQLLCYHAVEHERDRLELRRLEVKERPRAMDLQKMSELHRRIRMTSRMIADLHHRLALTPRQAKGLIEGTATEPLLGLEQMLREIDRQDPATPPLDS